MTPENQSFSADLALSGGRVTRRSFIKKSTLAAGALSVLGQGLGLAGTDGFPGTSGTPTKEVVHTATVVVTVKVLRHSETTPSTGTINNLNAQFPDNAHGSGEGKHDDDDVTFGDPVLTYQTIHEDAVLVSSNSKITARSEPAIDGAYWVQEITTVRTYVYGDPPAEP